jgi:hypothetical protein
MHLVIDGYNLIHATPELMMAGGPEEGRRALAMALSRYRKRRGHRITLVLDGGQTPLAERATLQGVNTIFSGWDQTADKIIIDLAGRHGSGLTVITDDRELADLSRQRGAEIIGSAQFGEKLMQVAYHGQGNSAGDDEGWDFTTKKKGPSRRLPKAKRRKKNRLDRL